MAQNITLLGASYADVPAVQLPKTGGGMATFYDVVGTQTFTQNGTFDVSTLAQAIINVSGSGGLEYESGTWEPSSNIARGDISFSKTHTEAPVFIVLSDVTDTLNQTTQTNHFWAYIDLEKMLGNPIRRSGTTLEYVIMPYIYRANSTTTFSTSNIRLTTSSSSTSSQNSSFPRYFATEEGFHPYTDATTRYWRSGRTYKWMAFWRPKT